MAFVEVARVDQMEPGSATCVEVAGERVGLYRLTDGSFRAIGDLCTHVGAPLHEGHVEGEVVFCPLHLAQFDLNTGRALTAPAFLDAPAYRVRVEGGAVLLEPAV